MCIVDDDDDDDGRRLSSKTNYSVSSTPLKEPLCSTGHQFHACKTFGRQQKRKAKKEHLFHSFVMCISACYISVIYNVKHISNL